MGHRKLFLVLPALVLLAGGIGLLPAQTRRERLPIIDVHQHAEPSIWADQRLCFPEPCEHRPTLVQDASELRPRTLEAMERYNIVLAVVSDRPRNVLPWTEGLEEVFLTGIQVNNPSEIEPEQLRAYFTSGRAQVLGELALQYEGIAIDDPSVEPMLALAEEFDLPVHVHVLGLGGDPRFPVHLGDPLRVAAVMRRHPKLRIYLENAGWPFLEEVTSLMYQYPTVYADLSTITHLFERAVFHKYLRGLMENGLGKRLMFGSDQMIWPEVIGEAVEAVESAGFLTEEQKRDIFYNNAARFFRLTEEQIARHHNPDAARD